MDVAAAVQPKLSCDRHNWLALARQLQISVDLLQSVVLNAGNLIERRLIGAIKQRPKCNHCRVDRVAIACTSQHDDARQRAEWDLTQYRVIRVERFLGPLE